MKRADTIDLPANTDELFSSLGTIQPHGILAIVAAEALTIDCISENVEPLLGANARRLCGAPLALLLDAADADRFTAKLREPRLAALNPHHLGLCGPDGKRLRVECTVHRRHGDRTIVEFEPCAATAVQPGFSEAQAPIQRLLTAPDITTLLANAVTDVRTISGFDRVLVYRFDSDWQCDVVAESTATDIPITYLGKRFAATHVPAAERRLHLRRPLRIFPDTHYVPARLVAADSWASAGPFDLSRATLCGVSPDNLDYLVNMGSRAMFPISIIIRGRLWGLIACHHYDERRLPYRKRAVCELISHLLAWQLDSRLQREKRREHTRASALRARIGATARWLQTRDPQRTFQTQPTDPELEARDAQAAALVKLHDDLAAALPSRPAIVDVILEFAQHQTHAGGSTLETLTDSEIVYEAATGMLARYAGTRLARAGLFSGISADLREALLCDDSSRDVERAEREACQRMGIASMVVVPIAISETATIVLKVVSARCRAFGQADVQTLQLAAANLSTALRSVRKFAALAAAEKEQRTYARQLRALFAIASTTTRNRKDQIDAALHLGLDRLDLDWAFLGVIDYSAHEFSIENSVSRDDTFIVEVGMRTPLGGTIAGQVAQTRGVRIIQDISRLDQRPTFGGWASYIGVPLFIGSYNYGVIGFTSRVVRAQPFSEADIEFVAVTGELIASAVERGLQRERLESSEARYRALAEAIPEMVWVVDAANVFEYVNARWTNYTGLTLEQSRALGREAVYDAEQLSIVNAGRSANPPTEYDCEVRLRRADGAYRWHLVRSVPFHASAGDAGKWLVTATDTEERKSAEAVMADVHGAALAATEAKSRFLATMSHEIRTPMNGVIGMTELLLLTQLSDEQREYLETVRDSGQSLLRVLNDILDYSKIEAGKLKLETVRFDLPGQVESVVDLLRAQYHIKGVRLTTQIGLDVPPVVFGDPGRLRQILINLLGNAVKFTPKGGRVSIDVAASPAHENVISIRFTVKDSGIGIPPDIIGHLFQPFSQGDESTTRKYGGTGLGLSICAQIVALMNGTIGVESVPGLGSAFWFVIPLGAAKSSSQPHDARQRGPTRIEPVVMRAEKILLVEDNEINTFLALKQLQRIGFTVSAVNNGQQAVEAVAHERFDLVFMDCHMPEMDGFEATSEIRRLETGSARRLPIVAMTADARTEDHQNCLRAGMDDYISKPTSLQSLQTVLDRWLPTPDRRQNSRDAAAHPNPAAPLGFANLLELFGGDRGAVMTLLTAAAGSIKADFARIENCAATHEFATVAEAAHRLKGTSASIRSQQLGEISAAVERAALTTTNNLSEALLAELRAAVDTLIADVEKQGKLLGTIG